MVFQSSVGRSSDSTTLRRERNRALAREHRADRVAQLFLIGREVELHPWSRLAGRVLGDRLGDGLGERAPVDLLARGQR